MGPRDTAHAERQTPLAEVLSVSVREQLPPELRAARVGRPQPGAESDIFAIDVAGMVVPREGQARAVELRSGDYLVREIPVKHLRRGLKRDFPDLPDELTCGFRGLLGVLVLPPEFELELVAVLEDGGRVPFATIRARRASPRASFEPQLRPLMLTSVGRTGTVWMMRMLASHPEVIVHPHGPYEVWPARYWAHMLKVLAGPADHLRSVTSHNFDYDLWHIGQNPFFGIAAPATGEFGAWLGRDYVDSLATFCLRSVQDWYEIVAREQGKENAVYFAEKNLLRTPVQTLGVADLYQGTREVFLVRDFRDMACSWLSFRGEKWEATGYEVDRVLHEFLEPWARYLVASWRARGEHAHLVRYEDLVQRPAETLAALFDYLEIDSSEETVEHVARGEGDQRFESHGTSPTLTKTVGRWRGAGDEAFRTRLNELFADALAEFGYADAPASVLE